jgi:hypothetical protein
MFLKGWNVGLCVEIVAVPFPATLGKNHHGVLEFNIEKD